VSERVELHDVTVAYDVVGEGEPVVLLAGCGSPAVTWHLGTVQDLVAAGYQVVTLDNRGVAPSSSPPPPYRVDDMVADTVGLLDHLGLERVLLAGHSLGGWIAERLAINHPERVRGAALMGSANATTAWELASTSVLRDLAAAGTVLPPLFHALDTMRYLPTADLQDDEVVEAWLAVLGDVVDPEVAPVGSRAAPDPGRLGQLEACLAWSSDPARTDAWPLVEVPVLVLAFEHDLDSPPARARAAAAAMPGARYVEVAGAGHLAPLTHRLEVVAALVAFFADL